MRQQQYFILPVMLESDLMIIYDIVQRRQQNLFIYQVITVPFVSLLPVLLYRYYRSFCIVG